MNQGSSVFTSSKLKSLRDSFEPMLRSMRGGANAIAPGGQNVTIGMQLIETFVIVLVFSITMQLLESNFQQLKKYQQMAVEVYPLTYNTAQVFIQDPSSCFPILEPSRDERNGAEYSYSCFINLSSDNFTGQKNAFRHVYHKGSAGIYPLMAPGVFFKTDTNTLRVYQNTTLHWSNYVDIPNIPLNKWFHLVVMLKGNALDVYINGNLSNRKKFVDVPKLNYSNFYLLNGSTVGDVKGAMCNISKETDADSGVANLDIKAVAIDITYQQDQGVKTGVKALTVIGAMRGYVSRVKYFAFALSYTQIDKLLREGPNKKIYKPKKEPTDDATTMEMGYASLMPNSMQFSQNLPFYQTDDWWTSDSHQGLGPQ
jgi:hypothetical protein